MLSCADLTDSFANKGKLKWWKACNLAKSELEQAFTKLGTTLSLSLCLWRPQRCLRSLCLPDDHSQNNHRCKRCNLVVVHTKAMARWKSSCIKRSTTSTPVKSSSSGTSVEPRHQPASWHSIPHKAQVEKSWRFIQTCCMYHVWTYTETLSVLAYMKKMLSYMHIPRTWSEVYWNV